MTKHSNKKRIVTYLFLLLLLASIVSVCILYKDRTFRIIVPERLRTGIWEFELVNLLKDDSDIGIVFGAVGVKTTTGERIVNLPKTSANKKGFSLGSTFHVYKGKIAEIDNSYYPSTERDPDTQVLSIDTSGKYIAISRQPKSTKSNHRVLYVGCDIGNLNSIRNKHFTIEEGAFIKKDSFSFNPNPKRRTSWLCVATKEALPSPIYGVAGREQSEWVIVDGIPQEHYSKIRNAQFSPDGEHIGYFAEVRGKGIVHVIDGIETGEYHDRVSYPCATSYGGKTIWICVVGKNGNMRLCRNGKEGKPYEYIAFPSVSEAGDRIAFGGKEHVGESPKIFFEEAVFDVPLPNLNSVQISPDGSKVAYIISKETTVGEKSQMTLCVNGETIATHNLITDFHFSSNSEHYAYIAANSDGESAIWSVYIDNNPSNLNFEFIGSLNYGSNNDQVAYIGLERSKLYFVKNHVKSIALTDVYGDYYDASIYSDKHCFRIIAKKNEQINMMEWYYRD
jgi:hypothetical protein